MERIELKNGLTGKKKTQIMRLIGIAIVFLGIIIYNVFFKNAGSSSTMFSIIWWSALLAMIIIFPLVVFSYFRPHLVILESDGFTLVSLFRKKTIYLKDMKKVYDWGRRENRRGERVLYYGDTRYDMHWLTIDVQDRIISEYQIAVNEKR